MQLRDSILTLLGLGLVGSASTAMAQSTLRRYDFTQVTNLASGMISGQNVDTPVRGFDLLLIVDGKRVYHRSFGLWSLDRAANADSATKTLSGAMMLSLTERSTQPFTLDTRVSTYIPAFNTIVKRNITVRQCFSHMSGYGGTSAEGDQTLTLQQAAVQIAGEPLSFLPGSTFNYGGAGMHAAGAVGELVGDGPGSWNTMFAERFGQPLGFTVTRFVLTTLSNPRIAGGCESNASEFVRFMEMLRRGGLHKRADGTDVRLLTQASVNEMFTRQTPVGVPVANSPLGNADYGVGVWLDERTTEGTLIGAIAGGARGFSSWIDFDDEIVGVFATDTTSNSNVRPALYLIRDAAAQAVRNPLACVADFDQNSTLAVEDVFAYLNAWFAGDASSDVDGLAGLSPTDIFAFLNLWFEGCV